MTDFLDWLARGTGIVAVLVTLIGFMFREKWKQVLQRSLSSDLERLKAELVRENAEHAAALLPQFEQVKHDFQQKLEAYKVTLIAQAEAAKAQSELKKTIALRYCEVEFERLVALELIVAPIGSDVLAVGMIDVPYKSLEQLTKALSDIRAFGAATEQAEMFMPLEDRMELSILRQAILDFVLAHVGPGKPLPPANYPLQQRVLELSASTHSKLKSRIKGLGTLPQVAQ